MNGFKNINISTKIFGGFGIVLALLLIISAVGYFELTKTGENFTRYRALALQTNQSGRIQANLLEARLHVKDFIIKASQENIDAVIERANVTMQLIDELEKVSTDADHTKVADNAKKAMVVYLAAFEEVTKKTGHSK